MARPTKQGIDYFPLDCSFDDKTKLYLMEHEGEGLGVLVTIWQLAYSNQGYFVYADDDLPLLIKGEIGVGINVVSDCINTCLRRNIFSQKLYDRYRILTSKAIQKRYFEAAKKKKGVQVTQEFLLISVSSYKNLVYSDENPVIGGINTTKEEVEVKEEVKEKINKKEPEKNWSLPDWVNPQAWEEFEQHRSRVKKKEWTDIARTKAANKLNGFSFEEQQTAVDESIAAGYPGLYPKKLGANHETRQQSDKPESHHQKITRLIHAGC